MEFEPLAKVMEGWLDKRLAELPEPQRKRLDEADLSDRRDFIKVDLRLCRMKEWDVGHDPANRDELQRGWDLAAERHEIERQIRELEQMRAQSPLEFESKNWQLQLRFWRLSI